MAEKAQVGNPDFDWSAIGKKQENYSNDEKAKFDELYGKSLNTITDLQIIEGRVVAKNNREVVVNIGYKSDGVVALSEFRYNPDLKIGDTIEVFVEQAEDASGQLVLSHKKARANKSWDRVNSALNTDEVIKGFVKCRTKGGLIVDVFGIEAFLPGSQIDVKPIRDYDIYVGKTMEFKVVKINNEFKNVVVSHKALIEAEIESQKKDIISKLEKGQVLEGTVKNITSYGVFIDLGGVDGLVHITDLSWGRINHPEEIVKLDEKIQVVILEFDDEKKRIALGLKQLTPHPWEVLDATIQVGSVVKGKIVNIEDYGAFLEIMPGVEGLVHVSEITWSNQPMNSKEFFTLGNEYEAKVVTLDREERKMSLSLKQLSEDPWKSAKEKYPIGSRHSGLVKNLTNYGVFVELDENIGGMVHISDLSWIKRLNHPSEFVKVGQTLDVVILDIDEENRKMSLGHKQIEEDPWDTFEQVFPIGSVHEGTITRKDEKGALVSLPYGLEGYAPNKHLEKADGTTAHAEEVLPFKVIEFDRNDKRILVSHTKFAKETVEEEKREVKKERQRDDKKTKTQLSKVQKNVEKTTLGELDVLSQLKEQMAKDSKESQSTEATDDSTEA